MTKKNIYLFFFLFIFLLSHCSIPHNQSRQVWYGDKHDKELSEKLLIEQKTESNLVRVFSSGNIYDKEIEASQNAILSKSVKNTSWKMSGKNYQNFLGNIYYSGLNKKFLKKKIGKNKFSISNLLHTPLIFNNYIIMSDDTGTIFKLTKSGKIIWKNNIYKKVYKNIYKTLSFSIYKNKIFVADNIGLIYCIDFKNGNMLWIKNHGIPLKSKIKVYKNKIFVINQDNRILSLDATDGSKVWDIRTVSSFIKSQNFLSLAISEKGDLISLTSTGDLSKVNTVNGRIYWTFNATGSSFAHDTDFFSSSEIVIADNEIIFSTSTSTFSYNLTNGYLNWKIDLSSSNTPIVDANNVFLVSNSGFFVNIERNSGKILWSTNLLKSLKKRKQNTKISGVILGSDKIYSVTLNGDLIVASANSGKFEYSKNIANSISSPPIISNGSLYLVTSKSKLLGFN